MKLSSGAKLIASNLFWAVVGKAVTLIGSLFVGVVVARYLGPEQYGLMNYIVSFVALFQIFATFGLDNIEIREEAKPQNDCGMILCTALYVRLMLATLTIIATITTSFLMEAETSTTILVATYSMSMIANTFNILRNHFTAIVQNEYIAKTQVASTIAGISIKVTLLLLDAPLWWFVLATTLDYFALAIGYIISYKKKIKNKLHWTFDKDYAKYLLKESFPILLTSAAVIIYQRIDQVMIGRYIDNEAVGYFSVAARIVEILTYMPQIAMQAIMPLLIKAREQDTALYKERATVFMGLTVWTTLIAAFCVCLLSPFAITLLFGQAYIASIPILQILAFKAAAVALSSVAGHLLIVEGLQRWAILRDSMGCIACITLNIILLPQYGVIAAAFVAIFSNIVAGYLADVVIKPYRHLFVIQTKALFLGWSNFFKIKTLIKA